VVIDVLDRLSRDEGDVGAFYHHADRHGVTIELASEDRDETEKGRMMRTLTGMFSRMERAEIIRRTQRGKRKRVTDGNLLPGATPLYGYLWADPEKKARTRYIVDPETAPIIVRIWTRIAEGVSIREVARELDADGIPTPAQVLRHADCSARSALTRLTRAGIQARLRACCVTQPTSGNMRRTASP